MFFCLSVWLCWYLLFFEWHHTGKLADSNQFRPWLQTKGHASNNIDIKNLFSYKYENIDMQAYISICKYYTFIGSKMALYDDFPPIIKCIKYFVIMMSFKDIIHIFLQIILFLLHLNPHIKPNLMIRKRYFV